jgi:hypothetical protein
MRGLHLPKGRCQPTTLSSSSLLLLLLLLLFLRYTPSRAMSAWANNPPITGRAMNPPMVCEASSVSYRSVNGLREAVELTDRKIGWKKLSKLTLALMLLLLLLLLGDDDDAAAADDDDRAPAMAAAHESQSVLT